MLYDHLWTRQQNADLSLSDPGISLLKNKGCRIGSGLGAAALYLAAAFKSVHNRRSFCIIGIQNAEIIVM